MNEEEKTAWIDEENKIVSFHAIDNAKMIMLRFGGSCRLPGIAPRQESQEVKKP